MGGERAERFGIALWLRTAVTVALFIWMVTAAWLVALTAAGTLHAPWAPLATALAFVVLFAVALEYYGRRAFIVDLDGLTVCGVFTMQSFGWDEVLGVRPYSGALPGYIIETRRGELGFTCLELPGHRRLLEWLHSFGGARRAASSEAPPRPSLLAQPLRQLRQRGQLLRRRRRRHRW